LVDEYDVACVVEPRKERRHLRRKCNGPLPGPAGKRDHRVGLGATTARRDDRNLDRDAPPCPAGAILPDLMAPAQGGTFQPRKVARSKDYVSTTGGRRQ
jgi:hypothetical protein